MGFHPKTAISRNKDERPRREHELRGVSSLILDFEAVRMNARNQGVVIAPSPRAGIARNQGPASIQGPAMSQAKGPVIAALAARPMQKMESRRNLHFSLRLSAIPCLLICFSNHIRIICVFAYFAFLPIVAMPVAVIPLISSSASHRMELLVSPVLGSFVFPVLSEVEAAAAFFSHTAV